MLELWRTILLVYVTEKATHTAHTVAARRPDKGYIYLKAFNDVNKCKELIERHHRAYCLMKRSDGSIIVTLTMLLMLNLLISGQVAELFRKQF